MEHVPIQRIENVRGDVTLLLTDEFANTGTSSRVNWRLSYMVAPNELDCGHVSGRFTAWCGRMSLTLHHLGGGIDVRNDFGDTTLTIDQPLARGAQRVVSDAGRIDVVLPNIRPDGLMLFAATSYGRVETNADREILEELDFGTRGREPGELCNWPCSSPSPRSATGKRSTRSCSGRRSCSPPKIDRRASISSAAVEQSR